MGENIIELKDRLKSMRHKSVCVDVNGYISFLTLLNDLYTYDEYDEIVLTSGEDEQYVHVDTSKIIDVEMDDDLNDIIINMGDGIRVQVYEN